MARYRSIQMSFWTDSKIVDDFTPEDKYFFLYLMTNPHTNLCGCYEISFKQMSDETGYSKDTVSRLIERFSEVHNIVRYSKETKELWIMNWNKHNWTTSSKFRNPLEKEILLIKCSEFRKKLLDIFYGKPIEEESIKRERLVVEDLEEDAKILDYDKAWETTREIYPKKRNFASAKTEWMDILLYYPRSQHNEVAGLIYSAIKLYLADYQKNNAEDEKYQYIPSLDKWMVEDCKYWMHKIKEQKQQ